MDTDPHRLAEKAAHRKAHGNHRVDRPRRPLFQPADADPCPFIRQEGRVLSGNLSELFCVDSENAFGTLIGKNSNKNLSMTKTEYDKIKDEIEKKVAFRGYCKATFSSKVYKLRILECTDPQNLATCHDYEYITIIDKSRQ